MSMSTMGLVDRRQAPAANIIDHGEQWGLNVVSTKGAVDHSGKADVHNSLQGNIYIVKA